MDCSSRSARIRPGKVFLHLHTFHLRRLIPELECQCRWIQSFLMLPGYVSGPGMTAVASPAVAPPPAPKAAACPVRASADRELVSVFLCYCADTVGGVRHTTPTNIEVPSQRQGIYTRDHTTGQVRVLSPTVYTAREAGRITAAWAPKGLAVLANQQQQVRRIY